MNTPDLNKPAFKVFTEQAKSIKLGNCPFCKKPVLESDFKDALSKKEYSISGLCQKCQDSIFGA